VVVVVEEEAMPADRNGDWWIADAVSSLRFAVVRTVRWRGKWGRAHGGEEERGAGSSGW
jgi:hypothetical protein